MTNERSWWPVSNFILFYFFHFARLLWLKTRTHRRVIGFQCPAPFLWLDYICQRKIQYRYFYWEKLERAGRRRRQEFTKILSSCRYCKRKYSTNRRKNILVKRNTSSSGRNSLNYIMVKRFYEWEGKKKKKKTRKKVIRLIFRSGPN